LIFNPLENHMVSKTPDYIDKKRLQNPNKEPQGAAAPQSGGKSPKNPPKRPPPSPYEPEDEGDMPD
jgi:hypothetical protein